MQYSGLDEFTVELLIISYSLNRSSKHFEEQKLESFYER